MIKRLKPFMEEPPPTNEYFEIVYDSDTCYVSREAARRVIVLLQRRWAPRWIRIMDAFGPKVHGRSVS